MSKFKTPKYTEILNDIYILNKQAVFFESYALSDQKDLTEKIKAPTKKYQKNEHFVKEKNIRLLGKIHYIFYCGHILLKTQDTVYTITS